MKAAIVILSDLVVQNFTRRIVFDLNTRSGVPLFASLLPAHVSLKQPFTFERMDALENYFDSFATSHPSFQIALDRLYCETWEGYGILGLNVTETPILRELHNTLNAELPGVVQDARAPHDGPEYRFHLTIEMGKIGATNPFQAYYDSLPDPEVDLRFTASQLALFYYPEPGSPNPNFITYRVMSLTQ